MKWSRIISRVRGILQFSDLLASPYKMRADSQSSNGTSLGGLLTFFSFFFLGAYFFSFYINSRIEGTTYQLQENIDHLQTLGSQNFSIAFTISKDQTQSQIGGGLNFHDLFDFSVEYISKNINESTKIYDNRCDKTTIPFYQAMTNKYTEFIVNTSYYCLKDEEFLITGDYGDVSFSYLKISLLQKSCQAEDLVLIEQSKDGESINNIQLACSFNQSQFDQVLKMFRINLLLPVNIPGENDQKIKSPYWELQSKSALSYDIFFSIYQQINIYQQFLANWLDQNKTVVINQATLQSVNQLNKRAALGNYLTFYFRSSQQEIQLTQKQRSWGIQLLDSLSQFGGLLVSVLGGLGVFYNHYHTYKKMMVLLQKVNIFDLNPIGADTQVQPPPNLISSAQMEQSSAKQSPQQKKGKRKFYELLTDNIKFSYIQFIKYTVKQLKHRLIKIFQSKDSNESEFELVSGDIDEYMFHSGINCLKEDLDLVHILNRLYEIDLLQMYLFNRDELALFNALAQPVIRNPRQFELRKSFRMQKSGSYNEKMKDFNSIRNLNQQFQVDDEAEILSVYQRMISQEISQKNFRLLDLVHMNSAFSKYLKKQQLYSYQTQQILLQIQDSEKDQISPPLSVNQKPANQLFWANSIEEIKQEELIQQEQEKLKEEQQKCSEKSSQYEEDQEIQQESAQILKKHQNSGSMAHIIIPEINQKPQLYQTKSMDELYFNEDQNQESSLEIIQFEESSSNNFSFKSES